MKTRIVFLCCCLSLVQGCFYDGSGEETTVGQETETQFYLNDTGSRVFLEESTDADGDPEYGFTNTASTSLPGQDGEYGRDVSDNNDGNGIGGFDFSKLDASGTPLSTQNGNYVDNPWSCVKDKVTGLVWEVKQNTGLQNYIHRFTWYDPDTLSNGGNAGNEGNATSCGEELVSCNTNAYIETINSLNQTGLCNYSDWRLPTREELRSLLHYGKEKGTPMIDTDFFPFTAATDHWTSQTAIYADINGSMAWEVHFEGGHSEAHEKQSNYVAVRLVRGPES